MLNKMITTEQQQHNPKTIVNATFSILKRQNVAFVEIITFFGFRFLNANPCFGSRLAVIEIIEDLKRQFLTLKGDESFWRLRPKKITPLLLGTRKVNGEK